MSNENVNVKSNTVIKCHVAASGVINYEPNLVAEWAGARTSITIMRDYEGRSFSGVIINKVIV